MQSFRKPILVTGAHRSGTTWVGRTIAAAPEVTYIHEPIRPDRGPCSSCGYAFSYWYQYISQANSNQIRDHLDHAFRPKAYLPDDLPLLRRPRLAAYRLARYLRVALHSSNQRPLIKDPFALVSAEWLHSTYGMDVIILIRHPAAFVSSVKRLDWRYDLSQLLKQPLLMDDYLSAYQKEIEDAQHSDDIIYINALLWKLLYSIVSVQKERHPDWFFIRHEDLARDPMNHFREVFQYLNLPFESDIQHLIKEATHPTNPDEVDKNQAFSIERNSEAVATIWRQRLTVEEVKRIETITSNIAGLFYSSDEW